MQKIVQGIVEMLLGAGHGSERFNADHRSVVP
jgi:hypothetical protein